MKEGVLRPQSVRGQWGWRSHRAAGGSRAGNERRTSQFKTLARSVISRSNSSQFIALRSNLRTKNCFHQHSNTFKRAEQRSRLVGDASGAGHTFGSWTRPPPTVSTEFGVASSKLKKKLASAVE